jgi:ankyrin repeat protein
LAARGAQAENDVAFAELLIAAGADLNVKDDQGLTPLTWAKIGEKTALVEFLISKGARE